jgi:hypothetical protein
MMTVEGGYLVMVTSVVFTLSKVSYTMEAKLLVALVVGLSLLILWLFAIIVVFR